MALRIAVFGQGDFGATCVDRFREDGHEVVAIFAPADSGRPEPLAARAGELGVPLVRRRFYQKKTGETIPEAVESYRSFEADLNVLASFTSFLPADITDAPPHSSLCFHPSLLPRFRGGNAMQWQIILGEPEVGVSIFIPDEGVDTGPIVVQRAGVKIEPADNTTKLFFKKLQPLGIEAMVEAVNAIDRGTAAPKPQNESQATHQGLVSNDDAAVDLDRPANQIDRLVRGCDPQPGAWVRLEGEPLRLYDAQLEAGDGSVPGTVIRIDKDGLLLALSGGALRIGRVRADAGKEPVADFAARRGLAAGHRIQSA